jgi:hypothetical protein
MKLIDYTLRLTVPGLGIDIRWLKDLLEARRVKIRLTDSCVEELAEDAEIAAWRIIRGSKSQSLTYLECLREQLALARACHGRAADGAGLRALVEGLSRRVRTAAQPPARCGTFSN